MGPDPGETLHWWRPAFCWPPLCLHAAERVQISRPRNGCWSWRPRLIHWKSPWNHCRTRTQRSKAQIAALQREQAEFVQQQEAAQSVKEHEEEVADFEEDQKEQLIALEESQSSTLSRMGELDVQVSALEEGQTLIVERLDASESRLSQLEENTSELNSAFIKAQSAVGEQLDDLDTRMEELEATAFEMGWSLPAKEDWTKSDDKPPALGEGTVLERTRSLAEAAGGEVYNIDNSESEERAILVMPREPIDGNPLIVSLHGYGSNSADHSRSFPLHSKVVSRGFGLLLPNGTPDSEGNPAWNPTDRISSSGKASADDAAYLAGLVARARELKNFGPVYIFGYSNGGFMAYHIACKGLPGLRAIASLAGTSYVDDTACEGAAPVSVRHIHGGADEVILFNGKAAEPGLESDGGSPSYASAQEMLKRWGQRAGCEWPRNSEQFAHYATLDLDQYVQGPETLTFRTGLGCPEGINIELWSGPSSGHSPGYGDAFVGALLDWLVSQQ